MRVETHSSPPRRLPAAIIVAIALAVLALAGWAVAFAEWQRAASAATSLRTQAAQNQVLAASVASLRQDKSGEQQTEQELAQTKSELAGEQHRYAMLEQQSQSRPAAAKTQTAEPPGRLTSPEAAERRPRPTAPDLSASGLPPGQTGRDYLVAAQQALRAGDYGRAEAALGRAEIRILNGESLRAGRGHHPSVEHIERARRELGAHENSAALKTVDAILTHRAL